MRIKLGIGLKRKRGNVPVTILAIGIFVVCVLAIISFIVANVHTRDDFLVVKYMEKINAEIEDYETYQDLGRVKSKVNLNGKTVIYQEHEETTGFLFWTKKRIAFSVEYPIN